MTDSDCEFYGTKKLFKAGTSQAIYVEAGWGIQPGDMVSVSVRRQDGDVWFPMTKRISGSGTGRMLYLSKNVVDALHLSCGDWVVFKVHVLVKGDTND